LGCYHAAGGKAMIVHYDWPLEIFLSGPSWPPGSCPRLRLDSSIGAVAKALQALGCKPRLGAKHPEPKSEPVYHRDPTGPPQQRQRIFYTPARKRKC
jgi:hypothetical protein